MRKCFATAALFLVLPFVGLFPGHPLAADGEAVFTSLKCAACHKPDQKTVAVPLADIAKAYGTEDKLVLFFKGGSKMIIESEKSGMMKGQMGKLLGLSDGDKASLAQYILSFK